MEILLGVMRVSKKYCPWPWPKAILVFKDNKVTYNGYRSDLEEIGKKYFVSYLFNKNKYKTLWNLWEDLVKQYYKMAKVLEAINFKELSDKALSTLYKNFHQFIDFFCNIVHVPEIANYGGEPWLLRRLKKINIGKAEEYLEILLAPVKCSFFQQEELDLLNLASIKNNKLFKIALAEHTQKYHWLLNSYGGNRILNEKYFYRQLKNLLFKITPTLKKQIVQQITETKKKKKNLVKKLKLPRDIQLAVDQLSHTIWWRKIYARVIFGVCNIMKI